jgi:tRNA dimethylallyltransferase
VKPGRVIGLLGPTGGGKTAVAVHLAALLGTRIISCDSMQVYKGFPVLTNQPWESEDQPDLHELVGFADPGLSLSAGEFADLARPLVDREMADSGCALVVGGSGLYMRAVLAPLAAMGPADPEERRRLEERARLEGPEALHADLARLDADAAATIDHRNVRRVIRALERVAGGERWSGRDDLWRPVYYRPTLIVGLSIARDELAERISRRTEKMLQAGAVDEARRFRQERGKEASRAGQPGLCSAIGYAEICRYLDSEQSRGDTAEQISAATRRYARRQATWLRRVRDAVMIDASGRGAEEIARDIAVLAMNQDEAKGKSAQ